MALGGSFLFTSPATYAQGRGAPPVCCCNEISCCSTVAGCSNGGCVCQSNTETAITVPHITDEFILHREWLTKIFWEAHVLPAMMLMTEQITTVAMQQMLIVGSFFDAKHQLETQRLLQDMQAQAHKDYQPSTGVCTFGTNTRSLAASSRNADFTKMALASRSQQRQSLSGDTLSAGGPRDDRRSRLAQFRKTYCNPADFSGGLALLCDAPPAERINKDVNYTQAFGMRKTLEIDFSKAGVTPDEEDVLALQANLYGHDVTPFIPAAKLADDDGNKISSAVIPYMKARSFLAKRSVAQAAFAAQAGMRAQGEAEVQPYMKAILEEMGIGENDVLEMIGERPSYMAQMELLTKKLYQTPNFYTELYDKPTNIDRKIASMHAIAMMQRRDMYHSKLRSEAIGAVWLETQLDEIEDLFVNEVGPINDTGKLIELP